MTPRQFQRWSEFATRMALHAWPNATEIRKEKLVDAIDFFLSDAEQYMEEIEHWDGGGRDQFCVADEIHSYCYEAGHCHKDPERETKFENQINCCVRAGFDVAVAQSSGVIGFDIAMLKRMWHGRIPPWVRAHFDPPLAFDVKDTDKVWL